MPIAAVLICLPEASRSIEISAIDLAEDALIAPDVSTIFALMES